MNSRFRAAVCAAVAAVLLLSSPSAALGVTNGEIEQVDAQLSELHQQIEELREKKAAAEKRTESIQTQLQALESSTELTMEKKTLLDEQLKYLLEQIAVTESLILKSEEDIEQKRVQTESVKAQLDLHNELFRELFRKEYEQGGTRLKYLELLLTSRSVSDLLLNIQYIGSILDYEKRLIDTLLELIDEYEYRQNRLREANEAQNENMRELSASLSHAQQLAQQAQLYLMQLMSESEELRDMYSSTEKYTDELTDEINAELKRVNSLILAKEELIKQEQARIAAEEARKKAAEEARKKAEAEEAARKRAQEEMQETASVQIVKDGEWIWPVDYNKGKYTSPFGWREDPFNSSKTTWHNGIDLGLALGNNIYAVDAGVVLISKYSSSWGNYVVILHDNGMKTLYAHASALLVSANDRVAQGTVIARVGTTGKSTGCHLHFSVIGEKGEYESPLEFYPTIAKSLKRYF